MTACAVKANNTKRFSSNLIKLEDIWKLTRKLILLHATYCYIYFFSKTQILQNH